MLELIVVVILAGIGVVFTSYTGEEESVAVAKKSARHSADDLTEGVGIFGIDVGRKRRARRHMKQTERAEAQVADLHKAAPHTAPAPETAPEAEAPQPDAAEIAVKAKLDAESDDIGEDTLDAAEIAARAEVARADAAMMTEAEDFATLEFGEEAEVAAGADRLDIAPDAVAEADDPVADDIPLIDDFDPEEDQIVIAYRPEQAGSGRIGITADPDYPGAARITLGGMTVAIVLDGLGRVKAHHIDLVQEAVRATSDAA